MRHVLIAAAAVAACGLLASTAANAQSYQAGGPERIGSMCKVSTDANGEVDNYGFYAPCGAQALAQAPVVERAPQFRAGYNAGGPARIGSMCKVSTDANGEVDSYGYYAPCNR